MTVELRRAVSLPLLIAYGIGTIVGGGFYALVGKVAGSAGMHAPVAMLVAAAMAFVCALSFAELSSRYPVSAGESFYVKEAFRRSWLAVIVGWLVIATGVVSAATLSVAIVGFLQDFGLHRELGLVAVVAALGLVAAWGIGQSVMLAVAITVIEVGGLVFLVVVCGDSYGQVFERAAELTPSLSALEWSGIGFGSFLVFYGYIGFEDLVNIAEEVKEPRRNLPRAILWCVAATLVLYFVVTLAAVLTLPPAELGQSHNPLADVAESQVPGSRFPMTMVSVLAGVNGALVQVIMAARVGYGMSDKGLGPRWLARVNAKTQTPVRATVVASVLVLALALWFPLVTLAQVTSSIILVVFALVSLALWVIKGRDPDPAGEGPRYPRWVGLLGFVLCVGFLLFRVLRGAQ